jgi:hypothetical protein
VVLHSPAIENHPFAKRPIDRRGKLHLVSTALTTGALDLATPRGCRLALLDSLFTLPQVNQTQSSVILKAREEENFA